MVFVVSGLNRFDCGISKVIGPVFSVYKRFLVSNDPATIVTVFDQIYGSVILMSVCDKNQISRQVIIIIRASMGIFTFLR